MLFSATIRMLGKDLIDGVIASSTSSTGNT